VRLEKLQHVVGDVRLFVQQIHGHTADAAHQHIDAVQPHGEVVQAHRATQVTRFKQAVHLDDGISVHLLSPLLQTTAGGIIGGPHAGIGIGGNEGELVPLSFGL